MIVVSAATGAYGSLVISHLLNRAPATQIAVAVRNPDKAADLASRGVQVRFADYDDPASMRTAFHGADRLLFISSPDRKPAPGPFSTAGSWTPPPTPAWAPCSTPAEWAPT